MNDNKKFIRKCSVVILLSTFIGCNYNKFPEEIDQKKTGIPVGKYLSEIAYFPEDTMLLQLMKPKDSLLKGYLLLEITYDSIFITEHNKKENSGPRWIGRYVRSQHYVEEGTWTTLSLGENCLNDSAFHKANFTINYPNENEYVLIKNYDTTNCHRISRMIRAGTNY